MQSPICTLDKSEQDTYRSLLGAPAGYCNSTNWFGGCFDPALYQNQRRVMDQADLAAQSLCGIPAEVKNGPYDSYSMNKKLSAAEYLARMKR